MALVTNAGVGAGGPVELLDVDGWRLAFGMNYFGLIDRASDGGRVMLSRGWAGTERCSIGRLTGAGAS